jgi:hypothetical protein
MNIHLTLLATAAVIAGCATPPPTPSGAIVPMGGGIFKSSIKSSDASMALKTFTNDAEITCSTGGKPSPLPWVAKPPPPKYAVISQNAVDKSGKEIKSSDNKKLDAGIAVGLRYIGLESKEAVEITTVFKCE